MSPKLPVGTTKLTGRWGAPSETAALDPKLVYAFATEAGGRASHTAIMAGVLEIPAVVGLGRFLTDISGGDEVIVDGNRGVLIINPDDETRQRYEEARKTFGTFSRGLGALRDLPAETRDGRRITLHGNIEFPHESQHCRERGADGVGLYRTEFLYLNKTDDPTETSPLTTGRGFLGLEVWIPPDRASQGGPGISVFRLIGGCAHAFSSTRQASA